MPGYYFIIIYYIELIFDDNWPNNLVVIYRKFYMNMKSEFLGLIEHGI